MSIHPIDVTKDINLESGDINNLIKNLRKQKNVLHHREVLLGDATSLVATFMASQNDHILAVGLDAKRGLTLLTCLDDITALYRQHNDLGLEERDAILVIPLILRVFSSLFQGHLFNRPCYLPILNTETPLDPKGETRMGIIIHGFLGKYKMLVSNQKGIYIGISELNSMFWADRAWEDICYSRDYIKEKTGMQDKLDTPHSDVFCILLENLFQK